MFVENIGTIYSNIFTKKHRFLEEFRRVFMRIYTEMECDIGCEDGYFCEYYNEETKSCNYPNVCNVYKENKKKHWWQKQ